MLTNSSHQFRTDLARYADPYNPLFQRQLAQAQGVVGRLPGASQVPTRSWPAASTPRR